MPKSYKKGLFNLNDVYEEEVSVYELEDRVDPEITYKKKFDIIMFIIFLFCLGLLGGSLYYAYGTEKKLDKEIFTQNGEISVIHSKIDLGLTIESFMSHVNEETSSDYSFYIENNNEHDMHYKIKIVEKSLLGKTKIDIKNLQYLLLKNDKEVSRGAIKNLQDNILIKEMTKGNEKDLYILKLWSNKPSNKYYKYEIEVTN